MRRYPIFIVFLFFFTACTVKSPPRVSIPTNEEQKILGQVQQYLHSLQGIQSVKAYAKVKLKIKGKKLNFDEVIKIQFPLSFQFESLDDFANIRFVLRSEGEQLFWQDFQNQQSGDLDLTEKNIRKFIPMATSLTETLGFFIGKIPLLDLKNARVYPGPLAEEFVIETPQGELVWSSSQKVIVRLAWKKEGARLAFEYEGGNFILRKINPTKEAEVRLPSHIKLKDYKNKSEIEISYQDLMLTLGHF